MRLFRLLKHDIARESRDWVRRSIIHETQAEQICQLYGIDYHREGDRSLGYNVLVGLGCLFIGVAVVLLLGNNWDEIPRGLRMGCLVLLTAATHGFAIKRYMEAERDKPIGLFFLGNLFYGAAIILIAQIYHLGEHMPDGILWWALGTLPFALILKRGILMLQTLLLALIWLFVEAGMGYFPALFPLFLAASVYVLYQDKSSQPLFLTTVAGFGSWFGVALAELWQGDYGYSLHGEHIVASVGLFIFAYAFSKWLGDQASAKAQDYGVTLGLWCLRFALILLFIMSFDGVWEELLHYDWDYWPSMFALVSAICAATIVLVTKRSELGLTPLFLLVYLGVTAVIVVFNHPDIATVLQVLTNLALVASGTYLITQGIRRGITHYFFLGISTILFTALLRYFDLIGNYIGGAALFMLFAVILLGAAKFWKRQKSVEAV